MSESQSDPYFVGSTSDPSRAEPVSPDEYRRLCEALETVVLPTLQDAATTLVASGFQVTKLEARDALAGLSVRHRRVEIEAWLRFQVHGTFGPLLNSKRIFWMYTLRLDGNLEDGEPGRMRDLQDLELVEAIVNRFVQRCVSAAK
jgi:hypothetical protein